MTTTTFDPAAYKETTREQWQDAAAAWHRWDPVFDRWLGEATQQMLDLAHVEAGDARARHRRRLGRAVARGGAAGRGRARDRHLLEHPRRSRPLRHVPQASRAIATRVLDGESLDVEPGSFDAAISRLGLMYLPGQARGTRRRQGCAACGRPLRRDRLLRARAEPVLLGADLDHPHGTPSCRRPARASRGRSRRRTSASSSTTRGSTTCRCSGSKRRFELASAAECTQLERESFGALHQMLAKLDEAAREATWAEIEAALGEFEAAGGFTGPCELLVGAGTK